MKVGDLIQKIAGYGHDQCWAGIILGFENKEKEKPRIEVYTGDYLAATNGIEYWHLSLIHI